MPVGLHLEDSRLPGVPAYRYVLEFPDGEPADPTILVTALPPDVWRPGHTFLHGPDLEALRIVAVDYEADGVLVSANRVLA
jgi:hypothetical protein